MYDIDTGTFINHVNIWQEEGGFAKCSYYYIPKPFLFGKMVHKGGGDQNCPKICPRGLWITPPDFEISIFDSFLIFEQT